MSNASESTPVWRVETTEAVKPPGEGLASISHKMLERVHAMQELEGNSQLQGKNVCYAILTENGSVPVVLSGQAATDFKAMRRLAEAYRSPRAVLMLFAFLYEAARANNISDAILQSQLAAEYGVDLSKVKSAEDLPIDEKYKDAMAQSQLMRDSTAQ